MKFVSPVGAHAVRPVKKYVILSRRSATKDRKMRRLCILRSFAVCAAQDDGDFFTASWRGPSPAAQPPRLNACHPERQRGAWRGGRRAEGGRIAPHTRPGPSLTLGVTICAW